MINCAISVRWMEIVKNIALGLGLVLAIALALVLILALVLLLTPGRYALSANWRIEEGEPCAQASFSLGWGLLRGCWGRPPAGRQGICVLGLFWLSGPESPASGANVQMPDVDRPEDISENVQSKALEAPAQAPPDRERQPEKSRPQNALRQPEYLQAPEEDMRTAPQDRTWQDTLADKWLWGRQMAERAQASLEWWQSSSLSRLRSRIQKRIPIFWRHIRPRKLHLQGIFGLEEAESTAYVLAMYSMATPVIEGWWEQGLSSRQLRAHSLLLDVEAVWERAEADLHLDLQGRIWPWGLLWAIFPLILHRDFSVSLDQFQRIWGREGNSQAGAPRM